MEGTYPLPEAQLDRFFFKVLIDYLDEDSLVEVIDRTTGAANPKATPVLTKERILEMIDLVRAVPIADHVKRYAVRLARATHPKSELAPNKVSQFVKFGSSPRGIQAMIIGAKVRALAEGRFHVACEDVRVFVKPALRHRLILNFEGEAEDIQTDDVIEAVIHAVPEIREGQPA
jgi:MoxR-like ATPase